MKKIKVLLGIFLAVLCLAQYAVAADVKPGDFFDNKNCDKIKDMLPPMVFKDVKDGNLTIKIGKLNYDPYDFMKNNKEVKDNWESNKGKYKLNKDFTIVEAGSGQIAMKILGIPFPDASPSDPQFAEKSISNQQYLKFCNHQQTSAGSMNLLYPKKLDKKVNTFVIELYYAGWEGGLKLDNPDGYSNQLLSRVVKPYDMAGTATLMWEFKDQAKDSVKYAFVPSMRRARRAKPSGNSDASFGTDLAPHDFNAFFGTVNSHKWKLLGKMTGLVPYINAEPLLLKKTAKGTYLMDQDLNNVQPHQGYMDKNITHAAWNYPELVWVPQELYIFEMTPILAGYNYGIQKLYFSAVMNQAVYKEVTDRGGQPWKFCMAMSRGIHVPEIGWKANFGQSTLVLDQTKGHATSLEQLYLELNSPMSPADMTLSGFVAVCK